MITVAVYINNQPIILKTARNTGVTTSEGTVYEDDKGNIIDHKREEGAAVLAIKMLERWTEPVHG